MKSDQKITGTSGSYNQSEKLLECTAWLRDTLFDSCFSVQTSATLF